MTDSFERALAATPRDVFLWRELIITLMHAGRFEAVLDAISRARAAAGPHPTFDANEAVCVDNLGEHDEAERLFAPLAGVDEVDLLVHRARNRCGSAGPSEAAALVEPKLACDAALVAPYLSLAWRLTGDARWAWLEGDERLVGIYDLELPDRRAGRASARAPPGVARAARAIGARRHPDRGPICCRGSSPRSRRCAACSRRRSNGHIAQLPPPDPAHPTLGKRRAAPVRFAGSWSVRLSGRRPSCQPFPSGRLVQLGLLRRACRTRRRGRRAGCSSASRTPSSASTCRRRG